MVITIGKPFVRMLRFAGVFNFWRTTGIDTRERTSRQHHCSSSPRTSLRRVPQRVRTCNPTGLNVLLFQAFDTRSRLTRMGRKLEPWIWPPFCLAFTSSSGPLPIWRPGSGFLYCCSWHGSQVCDTVYVCSLAACQAATTDTPVAPARASDAAFGIIGSGMRSLRKFASSICEVPFDMDGELAIFLEAGRLLLDYHAPTMHDDDMHACIYSMACLLWFVLGCRISCKVNFRINARTCIAPPQESFGGAEVPQAWIFRYNSLVNTL